MYRVILVNRDIGLSVGNLPIPVNGRSGKLYGHAFTDPDRGGPIFEMTLEAYDQAKFDIIGNPNFRCQWVPIFEEKPEPFFGPPVSEVVAETGEVMVICARDGCSHPFEKRALNQIYCSKACRKLAEREKRKAVAA